MSDLFSKRGNPNILVIGDVVLVTLGYDRISGSPLLRPATIVGDLRDLPGSEGLNLHVHLDGEGDLDTPAVVRSLYAVRGWILHLRDAREGTEVGQWHRRA